MLYFFMSSFEKTLLPSMIAAFAFGPKVLKPSAWRASTMPSTSGSSGATTTMSGWSFLASSTTPSMSVAPTEKHSAYFEIPPFPGVHQILPTLGLSASFMMIACSRPPPPTTNTFFICPPMCIYSNFSEKKNSLMKSVISSSLSGELVNSNTHFSPSCSR